ncbi:putative RNA-binding protein (plasmid) [Legionella adelaidensis]|uniref:Putative RNA-binding protein n=1 Tax=Legionella adelaidensis TaxID=45056 RepID=A0A0W0R0F4_9GAMM|nr:ribosome assembly RNA-binding protein YhbY [Legionella adelaidensis]KTC64576.1 putative RNA-binding protein [Legionella adelaidensis]VEH85944.1 putative RNA-binding protein [Legionella adelaidensis]
MDSSLKQALKAKAHHLKPVILLGSKGLTPAVLNETDIALNAHELIKVKLTGVEKEEQLQLAQEICTNLHAELVQLIGNIAVIYRENLEK